jgi:hypothetical protein
MTSTARISRSFVRNSRTFPTPWAPQDFGQMKTFKLSGPSSRGNSGLLAGKKLSRASRVLKLPRLISERFYLLLLIRKIFSSEFSYTFYLSFLVNRRRETRERHRTSWVIYRRRRIKRLGRGRFWRQQRWWQRWQPHLWARGRLSEGWLHGLNIAENICLPWLFMYICTFI